MPSTSTASTYSVIATKVSLATSVRLQAIARRKGLSIYELLQMVCDTLVRYMDDRHNLTPDLEAAMSIFEHLEGWRNAFNLADADTDPTIGEAIYFLFDARGAKRGARAMLVSKPFFGQWNETCNIQHILERAICLLIPERYRRLRALAVENDCSSLLELLDHLIDAHASDADVAELRREFEDADRSTFGLKPAAAPFRRRHHHSPDDPSLAFNGDV